MRPGQDPPSSWRQVPRTGWWRDRWSYENSPLSAATFSEAQLLQVLPGSNRTILASLFFILFPIISLFNDISLRAGRCWCKFCVIDERFSYSGVLDLKRVTTNVFVIFICDICLHLHGLLQLMTDDWCPEPRPSMDSRLLTRLHLAFLDGSFSFPTVFIRIFFISYWYGMAWHDSPVLTALFTTSHLLRDNFYLLLMIIMFHSFYL